MEESYRVIGIDPGTDTLGVSVIGWTLSNNQLTLIDATTIHAARCMNQRVAEVHGVRIARLMGLESILQSYFHYHQPHAIASESPYMGRFPQAYGALVECLHVIRRAVYAYDNHMPLNQYDPATVKKAVGVSGKSGDKNAVRQALLNMPWIQSSLGLFQSVDEHAVDATAVAFQHIRQYQGEAQ